MHNGKALKTEQTEKTIEDSFYDLSPDLIIDAVESQGYLCDLRILALNSYENRVYQVGIEDSLPLIAKFYRPKRWTDEQILEEHQFSQQLRDNDIPVIPAIRDEQGNSLYHSQDYRFALFERKGGRAPELSDHEHLYQLGRYIGRIHATGASSAYQHRPSINTEAFLTEPYEYLLKAEFIPDYLMPAYTSLMQDLIQHVLDAYHKIEFTNIRLHGDCHVGNILWTDHGDNKGPEFLDFDDSRMGPAVQDIWMLLSGTEDEQRLQLQEILEGYEEFYAFNKAEIGLIESLRTMRLVHYAAWIAKRWQDPAFPMAFPWFGEQRYWEQHILELREQLANLQHKPLDMQFNR
ncbi:MAG: serine/threonine protein kinase [Gammaproteobacteria bacterium]|nr:serine/threonine protein kinase [Gammaproteobacteria bacterium]